MNKKLIGFAISAMFSANAFAVHNETIHLDEVNVTAAKPISTTQPDICLLYTSPSPRDRG